MRREYDFAFSLGFACGCTQALRAAGCQFASYPLDWLGVPNLKAAVDVVNGDFAHWFDRDDLRLVDVSHDVGFCTRIYLNDRTGLGYSHEFSDFQPFAETYPTVKASYERRVEHFLSEMSRSKRILAVYLERATRDRLSVAALKEQVDHLRARYPSSSVDLLYIYEDPSRPTAEVVSDVDGIRVVAAGYRTVEDGRVTQYVNVGLLTQFLREHYAVIDRRTEAEKQKFEADRRFSGNGRWGYDKSVFRRRLNQLTYKLYRHLEGHLRRKGLIHPKRLVWFWDERWQREHGEVK